MSSNKVLPQPRTAVLRKIMNPNSGEVLDKGIVLWFPEPRSFTGEDSVELHVHGGPAVCKAVLSSLGTLPGFTPAEPGEFTKRAFYNGKLDLTCVEGLGELIHAETEAQRKHAYSQMDGTLRELYHNWKTLIVNARASIEAYIDFSEDDNIESGVLKNVRANIEELVKEIASYVSDSRKGERLTSGINLVILGKPNVGKSSLLNALVRRPAAIVSPVAGTTRDVVKVALDIGGYPVNLSDTAGLRPTTDAIEQEGIARAMSEVEAAHMAFLVIEASDILYLLKSEATNPFSISHFISSYLRDLLNVPLTDIEWIAEDKYLVIINKIDLLSEDQLLHLKEWFRTNETVQLVSLKTFHNFHVTLNRMKTLCEQLCGSQTSEHPLVTSQRQRTHIEECLNQLRVILGHVPDDDMLDSLVDQPLDLLSRDDTLVLAAQRLQFASNQFGYITGKICTEEVLDQLFSSFCIGK